MPSQDVLRDLQLLFQSRYGIIHVDTEEEERALSLLHHVADRISIPLSDLHQKPRPRQLDLTKMCHLILYAKSPPEPFTLFVDEFRLE